MLEDIAVLTGGKMLSEDLGIERKNVKIEDLGKAKRVTVDKENSTIVEGGGKTSDIQGRVSQIKKQIEDTTFDYDRDQPPPTPARRRRGRGGAKKQSLCSSVTGGSMVGLPEQYRPMNH